MKRNGQELTLNTVQSSQLHGMQERLNMVLPHLLPTSIEPKLQQEGCRLDFRET